MLVRSWWQIALVRHFGRCEDGLQMSACSDAARVIGQGGYVFDCWLGWGHLNNARKLVQPSLLGTCSAQLGNAFRRERECHRHGEAGASEEQAAFAGACDGHLRISRGAVGRSRKTIRGHRRGSVPGRAFPAVRRRSNCLGQKRHRRSVHRRPPTTAGRD